MTEIYYSLFTGPTSHLVTGKDYITEISEYGVMEEREAGKLMLYIAKGFNIGWGCSSTETHLPSGSIRRLKKSFRLTRILITERKKG